MTRFHGIGQAILDSLQGKIAPKTALEDAARRAEATIAIHGG